MAPESLGLTLPHEHLFVDLRFLFRPPVAGSALGHELEPVELGNLYDVSYDWFSSLDNLQPDRRDRRRRGGAAVPAGRRPDPGRPTTVGHRARPLALQRVSRATGLHVIMGSGYYTEPAHPPGLAAAARSALAREIVRDVTEGVGDTGVRAGLIGEIGCSWPWTPAERKAPTGGCQRRAGNRRAAAMIHPGRDPAAPEAHLDEVRRAGLDPRRVVIAHIERTIVDDPRAAPGPSSTPAAHVEYDLFGVEICALRLRAGRRCRTTPSACGRSSGWWSRATAGRCCCRTTCASKVRLSRYGGTGLAHIPRRIVPRLRQRGLSEPDIRALVVENPARALTFV